MRLVDIQQIVAESDVGQWDRLGTPSYIDRFGQVEGGGNVWLEHDSHYERAVLTTHIEIGLAWGMTLVENFDEPYLRGDNDSLRDHARSAWVDVLLNGEPVCREVYVSIDSGRGTIPIPELDDTGRYWISRWQYAVVGLIDAMSSHGHMDRYVKQAGFDIR